ncbi:Phosphopantetheinyl transferase [Spirosomataceae bacterium TFI 002]|nr:Phosphopantetheinyl transferase [Spirosomataceae bacterium TFI 002]
MPQVLRTSHNSGAELIVWEVVETEEFFLAQLSDNVWEDEEFLATKFPAKRLELLAARYAAKSMLSEMGLVFNGIAKDEHGKPYLIDSDMQMSLTHTSKYVSVVFHSTLKVGIDLEKPSEKMWRIKERLFSKNEIMEIGDNLEVMSIFWSAKEALYKIYGKRGMDFKVNMSLATEKGNLIGRIAMPDQVSDHRVYTKEFMEYILVWVL